MTPLRHLAASPKIIRVGRASPMEGDGGGRMARHWGFGPVFARELVVGARRWQVYALRAAFVSSLLVWLILIWTSHPGQTFERTNKLAAIGQELFMGLVVIQLTLLLVAAPAATA